MKFENLEIRTNQLKESPAQKKMGLHQLKIRVYIGSNDATKYQNIADLLDKSDLSVQSIAGLTGHSINTVRKIKELKEI